MPTQEALQEWLQAPAPQRQVEFPSERNMSFVPTDVRANAGYDMDEMIKARDSGMSVSQFIRNSELQNALLKRQTQQQNDADSANLVKRFNTLDTAAPDYLQQVDTLRKSVDPNVWRNPIVGDALQAVSPILQQQEAGRRAAKELDGRNRQMEAGLTSMGVAANNLQYLKDPTTGEYNTTAIGNIEYTMKQDAKRADAEKDLRYLDTKIEGITDTLGGDTPPTTATINSARKNLFTAQSELGVPPDRMQKLIETPEGFIAVTQAQIAAGKAMPVSLESKVEYLTSKKIDPEKATERDWNRAYSAIEGQNIFSVVNAPPPQQDPYAAQPAKKPAAPVSVTTQAEAMKLPSGTRFVTPEGDVFTKN